MPNARGPLSPFEAIAESVNTLAAGLQAQAQTFMSAQANAFSSVSRGLQHAQAGVLRNAQDALSGLGQMAAAPMAQMQEVARKGAGFYPSSAYRDETPAAVHERAAAKRDYPAPLSAATREAAAGGGQVTGAGYTATRKRPTPEERREREAERKTTMF